jgi:hypothetical protein
MVEFDLRKCDESRPACARCQRNDRLCLYSPELGRFPPESTTFPGDTSSFSAPSAIFLVPFSVSNISQNGTPVTSLIQHIHAHWTEIFHMPHSSEILSLSKSNPLIENTILAIAACHLRHVSPGIKQHRIAEHFQQSRALRDFQTALNTPREQLGQPGVNALMLSAMLLNTVAFALPASETARATKPETSWVFSSREDRLGWLALQVGLRPLMLSIRLYRDTTISYLGAMFFSRGRESWEWIRMHHGLEGIPDNWIKLFELDGSGSGCESGSADVSAVLRAPIVILAQLRHLEPVQSNVFRNLQFLNKVQVEFRALLFERDEKALWLFGYWLGLMCRYSGVWWCEKRARRDYKAIYVWLQMLKLTERRGEEGELWKGMMEELEFAPVNIQS